MQSRRDFFKRMIGGVAAAAAMRTWPFRVYSFPSQFDVGKILLVRKPPRLDLFYDNQQWLSWDEEKELWIPGPYPQHKWEWAGIPVVEDPSIRDGKVFMMSFTDAK